ncbi:rhodanese-like domain-containing protein [Spirosoma spitsbergense]|jgi:rhodanese-related sulfurtransferase|uniref:rhodanese-like domain-containing protein n=1 Tax=Spirosoma spitsbergense TaxID=431554 RepID=UPI00036F300A|nr:rhodanese-like domain-containing protein [Spirosoma spitsbergense]
MKQSFIGWLTLLTLFAGPLSAQAVRNPRFDRLLRLMLNRSVPTVSVDELQRQQGDALVLDAREPDEFAVSHLAGAIPVGYKHLDLRALDKVAKDRSIVVYCSVGYRSQKVTKTLEKQGFTRVRNVYGGIFEWVNRGYSVINAAGPTEAVHAFNPSWGRWLERGQKVYN